MPYTPPGVYYSATINGTYTAITGVQSISINRGRRRVIDPYPASSCVIELIPANSYALPFAVGQFLDIRDSNSNSSPCYFAGKITDVERKYDFPYNAGTGAAPGDRIILTITGGSGVMAANYGSVSWTALFNGDDVASLRLSNAQFLIYVDPVGAMNSLLSAQTVIASSLEIWNNILNSTQFYLEDLATRAFDRMMVWSYPYNPDGITFSDTGSGYAMKELQFLSSVQNTFTEITVSPAGLTSQSVNNGLPPYNTGQFNTYQPTTTEALSLANYLYLLNSGQLTPAPNVITTDTTTSNSIVNLVKLPLFGASDFVDDTAVIGAPVTVTFRGTTTAGTIQGLSANFYPDFAQVSVYLSPTLGTPFTLDSASFGILNTNRLGYP